MKTYNFTLAHDVSVYGHVEVEADNLADAVEKVRADLEGKQTVWDLVSDVDYSTSCNFRVVATDVGVTNITGHIQISEKDESTPLSSMEVLAAVAAIRINK